MASAWGGTLDIRKLASSVLCHRSDNSTAIFTILLVLLCTFHDNAGQPELQYEDRP